MIIQEAIKSGRPFKRPNWTGECWTLADDIFYFEQGRVEFEKANQFIPADILADDWEVKP
jgi:hypothetical protein